MRWLRYNTKAVMTERDFSAEHKERRARNAVHDYLSVGPEPNFGQLEVAALDAWLDDCTDPYALRPHEAAHVGWMHIERAWSRMAALNGLGRLGESRINPDSLALTENDLLEAAAFFRRAIQAGDSPLRAHATIASLSLPMLRSILTQPDGEFTRTQVSDYFVSQIIATDTMQDYLKKFGTPHDIPAAHAIVGMRLLTAYFLETDTIALPSALRHSASGGMPYYHWQIALYDRDNASVQKVRISPYGPPDTLLLTPDVFDNAGLPSTHGLGSLEAMALANKWYRTRQIGQPMPAIHQRASGYLDAISQRLETSVTAQLTRIKGYEQPACTTPADPLVWFKKVPPHEDPGRPPHNQTLEAGINELELRLATETITPDDAFLLGWMLMESGTSYTARDTERIEMLTASLERAEDIFAYARNLLPAHSARYYEATIAQAAAPMYRAVIAQEGTSEAMDIYCAQLTEIARQMLADYPTMPAAEAEAITLLLQHITVYLATSCEPDRSFVALPSSPRQRGNNQQRGWDFTLWALESEDIYVPGTFYGRLEAKEDPSSIDWGIYTLALKNLGQWTPAHNFRILRTLLANIDPATPQPKNFRPDNKALYKARHNIIRIISSS